MFMVPLSRWRAAGPIIIMVSLVLIWLASYAGAFRLPNAWAYREYHRLKLPVDAAPSRLLLVEGDLLQLEEGAWRSLIEQLQRFQPSAIGVMYPPPRVPRTTIQSAREEGVLIGVAPDRASPETPVLTLSPSPWPEDLGLHQPRPRVGSTTYTSLEAAVALRSNEKVVARDEFLIDFRPGVNHLPLIDLERVLAGDVTRNLVENRVVLIGRAIDSINPPLLTPLPTSADVSRLMHAGYAVETLLHGRSLQETTPWQDLLLWFLLVLAAIPLYLLLGISHTLGIAIGGSLVVLVCSWGALHLFGRVLPTGELIAFHLLFWYLLTRREQRRESSTVRQVLRKSSGYLQERLLPTDFNISEDPWGHVILLTAQLLNLERAIVLERIPGRHHVTEVKAYGCSIDDIDERRRDFERTPYSLALLEGGPLLLTRTFLKHPAPGSRQFLVPLEFNGRVLGFFSGEVAEKTLSDNPAFLSLLGDFGQRISELLYRRQRFQARKERESSEWARLLRLDSVKAEYQSLSDMALLLERRISLLDNVFDCLQTSTIVYDAFGQVSQVNRQMKTLARRADLSLFSLTAADVLATLGQMPISEARQQLQYLVQANRTRVFSIVLPMTGGAYMLHVRPLQADEPEKGAEEDSQAERFKDTRVENPLHFLGFLFELVDVSETVWLERLKQDVSLNIHGDLHRRVESALQITESLPADAEPRRLQGQLEAVLRVLEKARHHYDRAQDIHRLSDFPVDPATLLEETARRWNPFLEARDLEISTDCDATLDTLVRVDAGRITEVLDAIMEVLVADTIAGKKIFLCLEAQERDDKPQVLLRFDSQGYGMPDERFKALLDEPRGDLPAVFHRLGQARGLVASWGGSLEGRSALGTGLCIDIQLPGLSLEDALDTDR